MRNKKAMAIEDFTELVVFILVAVFVVIGLPYLLSVPQAENTKQIEEDLFRLQSSNEFLIYYANYPVSQNKIVADLIAESSNNKDNSELIKITNQIIEEFFPGQNIGVIIADESDEAILPIPSLNSDQYYVTLSSLTSPLPTTGEKPSFIIIKLIDIT